MKIIKIIFYSFWLFSPFTTIADPILLCLTGKIELSLPEYKTAIINAANLALNQKKLNNINLKTYFYDNRPLSPLTAYNTMLQDHCAAIIGFEYLADLLLIAKKQKDDKIPIFTSYASTNQIDQLPNNFFIFEPSYDYQSQKMVEFLYKKFDKINNVLIITEIDRSDLLKYKQAYTSVLAHKNISYDSFDFISNDNTFESRLQLFTAKKRYSYIIMLTNAVNSTTIINHMNDHKIIFVGTENFGSSSNQSVYVRLKDKNIHAYTIRNIDFLQETKLLKQFLNEYKQQFLSPPNMMSVYTYDAMNLILNAIEQNHFTTPRDILNINFNGITGVSIKNQHFYRSNQYLILSIKNNGFNYAD